MPPEGVGVWEEKVQTPKTTTTTATRGLGYAGTQSEWELVDPMTGETINKIAVMDKDGKQAIYNGKPVYKVNDHWFVLNVKFEWTDAPEPPKQATSSMYGGVGARSSTPSSSSSKKSTSGLDDM
jgi:hypothetical protein